MRAAALHDADAATSALRGSGLPGALEHASQLLEPPAPGDVTACVGGLRGA